MRRLFLPLILLGIIIFVLYNGAELQQVISSFQHGDWRILVLACFVQAIWILSAAAAYKLVFNTLEIREKLGTLYMLVAASQFLNVIAPSAGIGGVAVFVSQAKRRGRSRARTTLACGLVVLLDYLSFSCILMLGLIVLIRRNHLNLAELTASLLLLIAAATFLVLIWAGMRSEGLLARILTWLVRQFNRLILPFTHRIYLEEDRARMFAHEASVGLQQLAHQPRQLALSFSLALIGKVLMMVVLWLAFLDFHLSFSLGTVVGGFSIGYLFQIVSPTPSGIGFVEGAMTLGLRSLGVPLGEATVVALAYRGVTLWLPLLFGLFALRYLEHQGLVVSERLPSQ
jgi:glycosyltransferase 2 family protein